MNMYIAELGPIMVAAEWADVLLNFSTKPWDVTIYSDNMSALLGIAKPAHQSGQFMI
jgi:hypothetical protein